MTELVTKTETQIYARTQQHCTLHQNTTLDVILSLKLNYDGIEARVSKKKLQQNIFTNFRFLATLIDFRDNHRVQT